MKKVAENVNRSKADKSVIHILSEAITSFNDALQEEVDKVIISGDYKEMVDNSPSDIAARYWLIELLNPLSRKELKSIVDGFLIQMLNEEQAKKLVKFLIMRYPTYYAGDTSKPIEIKTEGVDLPGAREELAEETEEELQEDEAGESLAKDGTLRV